MKIARTRLSIAALGVSLCLIGGCYSDAAFSPEVMAEFEGAEAYQPITYDGNVVYYDAFARPYCFVGGRAWLVPTTDAHYATLINHYYRYHALFPAAYAHGGYSVYRGYYGHPGPDGYHGYQGDHGYHGYPSYQSQSPAPEHGGGGARH